MDSRLNLIFVALLVTIAYATADPAAERKADKPAEAGKQFDKRGVELLDTVGDVLAPAESYYTGYSPYYAGFKYGGYPYYSGYKYGGYPYYGSGWGYGSGLGYLGHGGFGGYGGYYGHGFGARKYYGYPYGHYY